RSERPAPRGDRHGRRSGNGPHDPPRSPGRPIGKGRRVHGGLPGGGRGDRRDRLRAGLAAPTVGTRAGRSRSRLPRRRERTAGAATGPGRGGEAARIVIPLSGALRVARRELRAYGATPWSYAVAGAFLVLTGIVFYVVPDGSREATLRFWFPTLA